MDETALDDGRERRRRDRDELVVRHALFDRVLRQRLAEHVEAVGDPLEITHTVQVTSYGGSGTTMLCRYLEDRGAPVSRSPGLFPFKHLREPPDPAEVPQGFRVLYVYDDPRDAVVSLFRRGIQEQHYRWLWYEPTRRGSETPRRWVGDALDGREPTPEVRRRLASLEAFATAGVDEFGFCDHVERWLSHPPGYPVLFLRFDALPERWPQVRDFVGLPADDPGPTILERRSARDDLPVDLSARLSTVYASMVARLAALPPVLIVP